MKKLLIKNKSQKYLYALSIGVTGGIIWGSILFIVYYLQFTDVGTSIYAKCILNPDYMMKWQGHLLGVLFLFLQ